jgi:uncharacterized protein
MSQAFVIDARRFSRESRSLDGILDVREFSRLDDLLATGQPLKAKSEIAFSLKGLTGGKGEARLCLRVRGVLPLVCQRCLGVVEETISIERLLELVDCAPEDVSGLTREELEDETLDFLPVAGMLDLRALVEDEILLALPIAPRHATCDLPRPADAGRGQGPFQALAGLKDKRN